MAQGKEASFSGSATRPSARIGLALGSGSARGWAHIGVLRALAREGVQPDVVCGSSIGALVGAAAASGKAEALGAWAESLRWKDVLALMDVGLKGGLIKGERLIQFLRRHFADRDFADMPIPFACVATELQTGREIWLREGSVVDAVRASIALPGLMTPVQRDGRLLIDGGVVNPVPVSLCRAMGAEIVIAVDLGSDVVGRGWRQTTSVREETDDAEIYPWHQRLLARIGFAGANVNVGEAEDPLPSLLTILTTSINIMQVRIARSRLAGEPADVLLSPRLGHLGPMEYHRAGEAIAEGEAAVERMLPALRFALGRN